MCEFRKRNPEFNHVLWRKADILSIMNDEEKSIYNGYKRNIIKSDYARLIVLKYYGGLYFDLDVQIRKPIHSLVSKYFGENVFFESFRSHVGVPMNFANHVLMARPHSEYIQSILDVCAERKDMDSTNDEDVFSIAGERIVTDIANKNINNIKIITLPEHNNYFWHYGHGHWRTNNN
jgi:mannosyltransferase OCH1-like enzyme